MSVSSKPSVDGARLWRSLEEMARIGPGVAGGNCRLALTDEDKTGRDLFISWAEDAGCEVSVDEMGNIFARRKGSSADLPPVMAGSHLDTQPTGGRYDGVWGVLAALEVVRTLNDHGIATQHPLEVVVWTNEEGSRFQPAMMGSGVFSGALDLAASLKAEDASGKSFGDELQRIGYKGDIPCRSRPIKGYLEAHIEQGPILEGEEKAIGVVSGIQGIKWFKGRVTGINSHAGTTPMEVRRDPLVGMARMIDRIDRETRGFRPDAVSTVGMFTVGPGSINVINEKIEFSLDLRCPDDGALAELETRVRAICGEVARDMGLGLELDEIWHSPATAFGDEIVASVAQAAKERGYPSRHIVSGAGHDAKYLSEICPTGMVFIPCKDGISHNESESILQEHAAMGANVLLDALLSLALIA